MRFKSKPVEIEAAQWHQMGDHPAVVPAPDDKNRYHVFGAQGWSTVKPGDWIVTEPRDDGFYPCNPEVFAGRYEPLELPKQQIFTRDDAESRN